MKNDSVPSETQEPLPRVFGDPSQTSRVRKVTVSVILIATLLVIGAGVAAWLTATRPEAARRDIAILPPLVEVQVLEPEDIEEVFIGYGSARPDREVLLSAEVSGRIVEVVGGLRDGSHVAEEQVLIRIDEREYLERLARAKSQVADVHAQIDRLAVEESNAGRLVAIAREEVEVNRAEYERLTELYEKQLASKREWDFGRLAYQRSRRELEGLEKEVAIVPPVRASLAALEAARMAEKRLAELDVERCVIKAPFTGQVQQIMVEEGDRVEVGGPILQLIDPRRIEIPIELAASIYPRTKVGSPCVLTMDSMPQVQWEASVIRVSPKADERSRTFTAYVEVDNAEQSIPLVAGYFLTARVKGPTLRQVFAVPRGALVEDRIFVVNDGQAHAKTVQVDNLIGERAVISGDLKPHDQVLLTNLDWIQDGMRVRLRDQVPVDGDTGSAEQRLKGGGE